MAVLPESLTQAPGAAQLLASEDAAPQLTDWRKQYRSMRLIRGASSIPVKY